MTKKPDAPDTESKDSLPQEGSQQDQRRDPHKGHGAPAAHDEGEVTNERPDMPGHHRHSD